MVRLIKALQQNKSEGVDIKQHREHRSKKGRDKFNKPSNLAYKIYKKKKNEEKIHTIAS